MPNCLAFAAAQMLPSRHDSPSNDFFCSGMTLLGDSGSHAGNGPFGVGQLEKDTFPATLPGVGFGGGAAGAGKDVVQAFEQIFGKGKLQRG